MTKGRFLRILSGILIAGTLIVFSYNEKNIKILPSYQTSSMKDLHLTHKEGSRVKWELSADRATLPTGNREIFLESIALNINRSPKIYVTSGNGLYEIEKGDIFLNENVELYMKNVQFRTETMKWNITDEVITTDDDITFKSNNFFIKGTGLVAKIKEQRIRITNNVKAVFYR